MALFWSFQIEDFGTLLNSLKKAAILCLEFTMRYLETKKIYFNVPKYLNWKLSNQIALILFSYFI